MHCPPETDHVFVGAGDGPCAILMVGVRSEDEELHYPVSEVAARYGASVDTATSSPDEAYAPTPKWAPRPARPLGRVALGLEVGGAGARDVAEATGGE